MPFFSNLEVDTNRVFAVVTWGDLLGIQAKIGTDPEPTLYTVLTALFELAGQQQATGLRNLVQKTFETHRERQQQLAAEEPEGSQN